ncbi:PEP-CTERM sorting domain-containing protein [Pseudoduganella sp. SL102]|uniref:PEP-CTERM sorting domain-containing protein n=1 Tax=Pseudoduganella sp. SL102 TaxID=2995154 RepID=UPI00248B24A2|nr:PEP-CTERM sorting domain-containing protein [Pseudoduganella sp. SL102]WBS04193.1 PEP-CTERM sorting domain-containing protein [Pseudoduganella sp. SL102]
MKKMLKAAVLAACCMSAQAAMADEWEVTWQGFQLSRPDGSYEFNPTYTHTARFSGIDANNDSILSLDELDSLSVDWHNLVSCREGYECSVSAFSYSAAGGVDFTGFYGYTYPGDWGTTDSESYRYVVGEAFTWTLSGQGNEGQWTQDEFTPQTIETVKLISSVPEPTTYAMFGAGMLLLAAAAKRRKQQ